MLALLPMILSLAPQLAGMLFGSKGAAVTTKVASIVQAVTGQDPSTEGGATAAVAALQGKPELAAQLQQRLAELHAEMQKEADRESDQQRADFLTQMKLANEDTASARNMASTGTGPMRWGAPVISVIVILLFVAKQMGLDLIVAKSYGVSIPDNGSIQLLYAAVTLVLSFWLGSSNGSQTKDAHIASLANAIQYSVPVSTAEKMLASPGAPPPHPSADDLNAQSLNRARGGA